MESQSDPLDQDNNVSLIMENKCVREAVFGGSEVDNSCITAPIPNNMTTYSDMASSNITGNSVGPNHAPKTNAKETQVKEGSMNSMALQCLQLPLDEQSSELAGLGVFAYDQTQLETDIMKQLDEELEREREEAAKAQDEKDLSNVREEIRLIKQQLNQVEKAMALAPKTESQMTKVAKRQLNEIKSQKEVKQKQLRKLQARECMLLSRLGISVDEASDPNIQVPVEDTELNSETRLQLEQIFGQNKNETEKERLIRMGEMTPFGTVMQKDQKVVRTIKLSDANSMTDFEKYLLSEAEEKAKKKVVIPKKHSFSKKITSLEDPQPSTSRGLPCQTFPSQKPTKKRKKQCLGSEYANGFVTKKIKSLLNTHYKSDPEMSDFENGDFSDEDYKPMFLSGSVSSDEYLPDSDGASEVDADEEVSKKAVRKKQPKKEKNKPEVPNKEDKSDDEWSLAEKSPKNLKRVVDDGNHVAYVKRIKAYQRQKLLEKHQRMMEASDGDVSVDDEECTRLDGGYTIPSSLWNKLYRYQQTGVRWLWELHQQNCGGIIGDEMGLGKTIQVIAFLAGLHHSKLQTDGDKFFGLGPVILVCPATVMHQWVKEFHLWWPPLRIGILHVSGSYAGRKEALVKIINSSNGVLITSYAGIGLYQDIILPYDWHYIILDEGHKIRNPDAQATLACKQVRTSHRLILSGSPIQNNLKELWSLFDFIFPGKLGTLPVFMQQFSVPITQGGYSNATEVQVQTAFKCATVLRDTIKPYLLRRMKSDVKMTLNLPAKNEQVLFCHLTDEQRELYKGYLDSPQIAQIIDGRLQIFVGLINLRKICNHPDIFSGGPKIFKETDVSSLPEDMKFGYYKRSGKMVVVDALLRLWHKQGHRILLFTQSREMLHILKQFVEGQGYTYMWMDGTTPIGSRQPAIAKFNQDKTIFIFILTTRVGGLGVNLTGANRVIIYDPDWNPSTDMQARERAWRIGQEKQVTIYRLLTAGTIEEKIYHRQIFKQYLTNRVLKDPRQRRFFKTNDLHELFTFTTDDAKQTETSAIFAGTGSEIKLSKLKKRKSSQDRAGGPGKGNDGTNKSVDILPEPLPSDEGKIEKMKALAKNLSQLIAKKVQGENSSRATNVGSPPSSDKPNVFSVKVVNMECSVEQNLSNQVSSSQIPLPKNDEFHMPEPAENGTVQAHKHENKHKKDHHKHKKQRKKSVVIDGEKIEHIVKKDAYKPPANQEEEASLNLKQDEYVLQKLFKNAAVHTALKHDVIEGSSNPDYVLVEGEAERVAKEAVKALRQSRRQCFGAESGIPTWTGRHGGPDAVGVARPRFGQKKNPRFGNVACSSTATCDSNESSQTCSSNSLPSSIFSGVTKDSRAMSSTELLQRMQERKKMVNQSRGEDTSEDEAATSSAPRNCTEYDELLVDIRNFVAFQGSVDGQATTQEVLDNFRHRLPLKDAPVFKALLRKICTFRRRADGVGVWYLNPEFR